MTQQLLALMTCIILTLFASTENTAAQEKAVHLATISDDRINESSGIALSHTHEDAIWLHNDSGDKPRLFLVGLDGKTRSVVRIKKADAVDWEDMCSFQIDGKPWLLIADVGDNDQNRNDERPTCRLYLLPEPTIEEGDRSAEAKAKIRITFEYPDGPQNCESVAVDTERREILLLSKSQPLECKLYSIPLDLNDEKQKHTAERIASLPVPFATGMDLTADNKRLAIITMWTGLLVERNNDQSWADAVTQPGQSLQLPQRRQGESVCFEESGDSLLLNSEHEDQPLWRVKLPASAD